MKTSKTSKTKYSYSPLIWFVLGIIFGYRTEQSNDILLIFAGCDSYNWLCTFRYITKKKNDKEYR